jgi:hypothetical protein
MTYNPPSPLSAPLSLCFPFFLLDCAHNRSKKDKNQYKMTIESFKELTHEAKLKELKYSGELLGSYERNNESGGPKTPGDIYGLYDFWVYLSDDEEIIIPSRRNPIKVVEPEEE